VTPKAIKKASRALHPVDNAVYFAAAIRGDEHPVRAQGQGMGLPAWKLSCQSPERGSRSEMQESLTSD
jgi:hypothetical protein